MGICNKMESPSEEEGHCVGVITTVKGEEKPQMRADWELHCKGDMLKYR